MRGHRIYVVVRSAIGRGAIPNRVDLVWWSLDETGEEARALAKVLSAQAALVIRAVSIGDPVPSVEELHDPGIVLAAQNATSITYAARPVLDDLTARCTCLEGWSRAAMPSLNQVAVRDGCPLHDGDPGEREERDRTRGGARDHRSWVDEQGCEYPRCMRSRGHPGTHMLRVTGHR